MNSPARQILVLTVGVLLAAAASGAAPATKASNYTARTKERIDALVNRRLKPEPLPDVLPNPFQLMGVATLTNPADPVTPLPVGPLGPSTDSEILARYAAALKISGTVRLNGQLHLIINQSATKEGDLVFVDNKDAVIYLQVIRITPTELTLGYNQAVQTIKLKGL